MALAQMFIPDTPAPTPPLASAELSLSSPIAGAGREDDPSPFPRAPPPSPEQPRNVRAFFDEAAMNKLELLHRAQASSPVGEEPPEFTCGIPYGSSSVATETPGSPLSSGRAAALPTLLDLYTLSPPISEAHLRLQTPSPEESLLGIPVIVSESHSPVPEFYSQSAPPLSPLFSPPVPPSGFSG